MAGVPQVAKKKDSAMPIIGGVLIIIGAIIELYVGAVLIGGGTAFMDVSFGLSGILTVCGAILVVFGLIGVLGAIFAFQRKHFGLAILGGVLSLPGAFVPALIGLILVGISKDEFD